MNNFLVFREPPPRPLPHNTEKIVNRHYRVMQKYIGIALICFGCFHTLIFSVLKAPEGIVAAFGGAGVLGIVLLILRARGRRGILELLRTGLYVEGELVDMAKPDTEKTGVPTSYEILYCFRDRKGREWRGRTWIGWREEYRVLNAGDVVPICYNPSRPRHNYVLLAVLPPVFN